jgi:hypothetical protein
MPAASVYICQGGCGHFEPNLEKMHARGIVNEKLYCEQCVVLVDAYLKARDALHTSLSEEWSNQLAALSGNFSDSVRTMPDG